MGAVRAEFSSRLGFLLAASGSAVGLGNIWGFPTQTASNGGAAFLLIYLVMAFSLAYPALMAELIIGRHARANAVTALRSLSDNPLTRFFGGLTGYAGILTAILILSFYSIVAGWMVAHFLSAIFQALGMMSLVDWLTGFSVHRNAIFTLVFMLFTTLIVSGGVRKGIERWSTLLMPLLLVILLLLIAYVFTQEGAMQGLKVYLLPDFSRVIDIQLVIRALGQAFFSLSLGVGTMLIYGSYVSKQENLASLGRSVTLIDIGIAVMAGLLVLPAMYVAQHNGVQIFDAAGKLISEDTLIFTVLPALFEQMGAIGLLISFAFFILMTIAAVTSSISLLEVPVAYVMENHRTTRKHTAFMVGGLVTLISLLITFNFKTLFGLTIQITTRYSEPLIGLLFCVFAGWVWQRNQVLQEIKSGFDNAENSLFWKVWPFYIRYVCPLAILAVFGHSLLS